MISVTQQLLLLFGNHSNSIDWLPNKMNPESTLKPNKALTGVHGLQMVSHSPFSFQEIKQHDDFIESTCAVSNTGAIAKQRRIVQ